MEFKSFRATVEEKDGGTVRAYASTFDRVPDSVGDVVAPGAFDKTISNWKASGKPIPLLWSHDTDDPFSNIGAATDYGTDERGLWFDAEFDAENEKAQYVRKLVKEGRVFQCSFAYAVKDAATVELEDGQKVNELRELDLFEISIVQIPANQNATIEEVKSDEPEVKAGRRNSKADADEIRSAIDYIDAAIESNNAAKSVLNGLLAERREESEEPQESDSESEAKSEEPITANDEELREKSAMEALLQEAKKLLEEKEG